MCERHQARAVSGRVRVKPVRISLDFDPMDYDMMREFAHVERMTRSDVMRPWSDC